jgi:uncharacterized membrane protein
MSSNEKSEKLSRYSRALISFFFGIGVVTTGILAGLAVPVVVKWVLANPVLVVKSLMALCVFPVIWLAGRPCADLLEHK